MVSGVVWLVVVVGWCVVVGWVDVVSGGLVCCGRMG